MEEQMVIEDQSSEYKPKEAQVIIPVADNNILDDESVKTEESPMHKTSSMSYEKRLMMNLDLGEVDSDE